MRLPDPGSVGWVDGRPRVARTIGVPIVDPAAHLGLGVFETLAIRRGRAVEVGRHVDRLLYGAAQLGVPLPDRADLLSMLERAARAEPAACGWLRIVATRGGSRLVVTGAMDPCEEGREIRAVVLPWRRNPRDPLVGIKSTSYAANALGLERARLRGADEGLWLNTRGRLSEGCTSNLFVVRHGTIFTPAAGEGILPGITRDLAIRAAAALGIALHQGRVRVPRLVGAHEAFVTSSLCAVRPLIGVDARAIGSGRAGPVTRAVAAEVARMRSERC